MELIDKFANLPENIIKLIICDYADIFRIRNNKIIGRLDIDLCTAITHNKIFKTFNKIMPFNNIKFTRNNCYSVEIMKKIKNENININTNNINNHNYYSTFLYYDIYINYNSINNIKTITSTIWYCTYNNNYCVILQNDGRNKVILYQDTEIIY